jgi:hypothetical protein
MVPLPDQPEVAAPYNWLIEHEDDREEWCRPQGGGGKKYRVKDLLNGVDEGARHRPAADNEGQLTGGSRTESGVFGIGNLGDSHIQGDLHINIHSGPAAPVATPASPPLPAPPNHQAESAVWWHALIAPGVVGLFAAILVGLILWDSTHQTTILFAAFCGVFGGVYMYLAYAQFRREHWPKYIMFAMLPLIAGSALAPTLNLFFSVNELGRFHVVAENSPWALAVLMAGEVALGVMQVVRERQGTTPG